MPPKKQAELVRNPTVAKLLVDPMRREIVRLLASRAMTENELARTLGLSDPSVGHHLRVLMDAGLIRVTRKEVEQHGILQKFYETSALVYVIDRSKMPLEIERYFMPASLERARGTLAAFQVASDQHVKLSSSELEEFAKLYANEITNVAAKDQASQSASYEEVVEMLYRKGLQRALEHSPEKIKALAAGASRRR